MLARLLLLVVIAFVLPACAPMQPVVTERARTQWAQGDEMSQTKSNVTLEMKKMDKFPDNFSVNAQLCNEYGQRLVDQAGRPVMGGFSYNQHDQTWFQVALTNSTDHVLRLNQVVVRLFDPATNSMEPLAREELDAGFAASATARSCGMAMQAMGQFRAIKLFNRNMEVIPGTTETFWVSFRNTALVPGTWKFAMYDVPIKLDEAGRPVKTEKFEIRRTLKKYVDVYTRTGFQQPVLTQTREVTD